MTTPFENYECDNCGACCKSLIVEADYNDAQREPRLYQIDPHINKQELRAGNHSIKLYDSITHACPFLSPDSNLCGIYSTRPNECVSVEPGDAKCQQARRIKGLPLLHDKDGNRPCMFNLAESCELYGLNLLDDVLLPPELRKEINEYVDAHWDELS